MSSRSPLLIIPGLILSLCRADAAIITNGLLVDLDAASWSGSGAWANSGSLGGNFTPDGNPTKTTARGVNGVLLDGADGFVGVASPAGITGNADRSVEVWVYNGAVNDEETLVSWGKRGGPDGTNNAIGWGGNATWGAYGGWGGGPDQGFGALPPSKGQWNHIAMTFNAAGDKNIYVNGALATQETGSVLSTTPGLDILLGVQQAGGAAPGATVIDGGNKLQGGVIGRVRINDGALSASDILNNYNEEKGTFQLAAAPTAALTAGPKHRYSFNESSGTTFADTGTAPGAAAELKGAGAILTGTGVDLPGGTSATQAYIDLPNGVASGKDLGPGYSSVSYELFVTVGSSQTWSRILDFGTNTAGEVTAPGGAFDGAGYILLSNNTGGDPNMQLERNGGAGGSRNAVASSILGVEQHIVVTFDSADGMWKWYRDGKFMEGFASDGPSALNDVNNWLGRSNWAGDSNTDATYNEFRIYDFALSDAQVQRNLIDGPNTLTIVPEPSAAMLALAGLGLLARRRR